MTASNRAILILRQSLTRQDSVSLEMQEEQCRAYCHEHGYTIVREPIREESIRGWQEDREAMKDIDVLAQQRAFDVVVAWDSSRVARSVRLLENFMHELERCDARFESVTEKWLGTPFVRQVLAAVAEEQTRTISRNVSAAKAAVARRGQWHGGSPPLGYALVKLADTPSMLIPDEREGPLVQEVFRRVAAGETIGSIARDYRARGIAGRRANGWTADMLGDMIRNPVYAGDLRHRGEIVARDAHPALVDRDTWAIANHLLARRVIVRRHPGKPSHWLEGRILHSCGARMYLQAHTRQDALSGCHASYVCTTHYAVGRDRYTPCSAPRPRLSAARAGWTARRCLVADLEQVLDLSDAIAAADQHAGGDAVAEERTRIMERRQAAERRYQRVRDAWADGEEPLEWLEEQRARRDAIQAETDALLAQLPAAPDPDQFRRAAETLTGFRGLIDALSGEELVPVIAQLGTVIVGESTVTITYHPEYRHFVPSPHVEPIPAGLPRSVTATAP